MLIAMLTVFLLGGGLMGGTILNPFEVETITERVEMTIDDPGRAQAAAEILDELKTEIQDFDRIFVDSGEAVSDIYRDHSAGRHQLLKTLEALNLEWYASQNRNLKLRKRLKESITAAEWAAIFGDK
ncbi:MAG: hypothetical protein GY792_16490 [Gammaproteobacteria bacterium]|nr:hypothetical protein [Gammaproteobacteria bacterium]